MRDSLDEIGPPERLSRKHDISGFDSGEPLLDDWLRRRALQNEASGASRTYVVCAGMRVMGYDTLAAGAIAHAQAPVMVLGRLAVDKAVQRRGIGIGLLRDAILRTVQAAEIAGIRAILVHAISGDAKRFYESWGFVASPIDPMTVMITVAEAVKMLNQKANLRPN